MCDENVNFSTLALRVLKLSICPYWMLNNPTMSSPRSPIPTAAPHNGIRKLKGLKNKSLVFALKKLNRRKQSASGDCVLVCGNCNYLISL